MQIGAKPLEYLCKPLTIVLLIGLAASVDVDDSLVRGWFVAALVLSMLGDVWLMLPRDLFVPGLVSFLLAHIAFVVGLAPCLCCHQVFSFNPRKVPSFTAETRES